MAYPGREDEDPPSEVIERQLAHQEKSKVVRADNHAEHLAERKRMMQHWSDYLDGLRAGAKVVPIRRAAGSECPYA